MTLKASAMVEVDVSVQEILELILDLERYKQVDPKILSARMVEGPDADGNGRIKLWARLKYTPPSPDIHILKLERWTHIAFRGKAKHPIRLIFRFEGSIECESTQTGTRVTRSYAFEFRKIFCVLERNHRLWLQHDLEEEMQRLRRAFDGGVRVS